MKKKNTNLKNKGVPKDSLYTFTAFILFSALVMLMHFQSKKKWESENNVHQTDLDSLMQKNTELQSIVTAYQEKDNQAIKSTYDNYFDSFDSENYRVYGLLRDKEKQYTTAEISTLFNIFNTSAIKSNVVLGEKWFIVPVKGVHFVQPSETLTDIAQHYYTDLADSILIQKFNPEITDNKYIFIPFNK